MRIILLRHGESEGNLKKLFCGITDVLLTDKGRSQAENAGQFLSKYKIEKIFSSPLTRAIDTAHIAGDVERESLDIRHDFREMDFGVCEKLTYEEIIKNYPEHAKKWSEQDFEFKFTDGESMMELYNRVVSEFKKIKKEIIEIENSDKSSVVEGFEDSNNIEKYYLITAHSGIIRSILSHELSGSVDNCWKYKVENCGVVVLEYFFGMPILSGVYNKY
jgi:broad specificity phosphatase PhoE